MTARSQTPFARFMVMVSLIAAGEAVFALPFVLARVFRPTVLDVFGLTNLQLGVAFSLYGIVAMVSYFAGGPFADRYSARRLMTVALLATAAGGIVYAGIPSLTMLRPLYAYWGLTTIFLFWAALIRATREWGGPTAQGRAYGILDGGRGFFAALLASISVMIFAALLPMDPASATLAQRTAALTQVIWIFTALTAGAGLLVWVFVPDTAPGDPAIPQHKFTLEGLRAVVRMPAVWLQAAIVVCAYVGYKSTDDFSLFARDAFGYDDVAAAKVGTISFWVRPFAAIAAGLIADRIGTSRATALSFGIVIVGSLSIALGALQPDAHWMIVATVIGASTGIYALRGIYFALFGEARVPLAFTGSAVGVVSVIGFTPDVFMGPTMGFLLDRSPGTLGHQHVFAMVAIFGVIGLVSTLLFQKITRDARLV